MFIFIRYHLSSKFYDMEKIKLTIVYYSSTGTNYQLAQWAGASAEGVGAEVRLVKIPELVSEDIIAQNPAWEQHFNESRNIPDVSLEDLEWADALIFSCPTRYGHITSQFQQFIDTTGGLWSKGKLANKVVSAMTSAQNPHGGQETTLLAMYTTFFHWGAIVATPGYSDPSIFKGGGNPYGTSVSVDGDGNMKEDVQEAVEYQAKRTIEVAQWVKKGMDDQS